MKLGHLIHLDGAGGGPAAVINLVQGFRDQGCPQVVFHGGRGRIAESCASLQVRAIQLPIDKKWKLPFGLCALVVRLWREKVDVLVLHGQWGGAVGAIAAWLTGTKAVYVTHWPAFYTDWTPWRTFRNAVAEWIPCRIARRVVVLTPSVHYQYFFRGWAGEGKLALIPNPCDFTRLPSDEEVQKIRRQHGWQENELHVVSVGRLSDQKRVDWLLHAWLRVRNRCPLARLWIVGDGPESGPLRRLAQDLGLASSCVFLGAQPNGIAYMAAGDLVVMTTMYESFGYAACEAMACGRPVVATAADGVRDTVRDGIEGLLSPPGDTAALADNIATLLLDSNRRREMGEAGKRRVANYGVRPVVEAYLALARDICAG
jgi:glycosyltransferase involved in cell wall biosynthesis